MASAARVARLIERESLCVLAVAGYAAILLVSLGGSLVGDSWLLLVAGREIVDGGLPSRDVLTAWTAGRDWVDQQWLAHAGGYLLYRVAGLGGLATAYVAATVVAVGLAAAAARRRGASGRSAALVAVACAPALLPLTAVRPQILAYPLFVALVALLDRAGTSARRMLPALPLLVLWANLHGSAVLGAGVVGVWALSRALSERRFPAGPVALAALSWLCLLATPHGLSVLGYYERVLGNDAFGHVVGEWMRPSLPAQLPFFLLAGGAAILVVAPRSGCSPLARTLLAVLTVAGLSAVRHTAWLPLLLIVVAPAALDRLRRPRESTRRRLPVAAAGVSLAVVAFAAAALARPDAFYERPLEQAAAHAAADAVGRTGGPVFADPELADWLLWHRPDLRGRLAFDVRFELLSDAELRRLAVFFRRSEPGWRAPAECCRVLVLRTAHEGTRALAADRDTRVAYRDATTTVLVRAAA